jgi:LytR cell envelope-related transcriptional attenuator/LytR_cpsA_psr family
VTARVVASRAARSAALRRRRAAAAVVGVALVAAAVYGVARLGDAAGGGPEPVGGAAGRAQPSELLVFQVTGTEDPLIALVGTGSRARPPAFFTVPFDLTLTVPGQGEVPAASVAQFGGDSVRLAVANTFGAWAKHFARVDLEGLAAAVDRTGGVRVHVPGYYVTDAGTLGPGAMRLEGDQIAALLSVRDEGAEARWASVVQGLLRRPVRLGHGDLAETDGFAGVRRVLRGARGAGLATFPTQTVGGSVVIPVQPDLDRQVDRHFGLRPPIPVIVQNGVGIAGLGEQVAALLLPMGFRVVVSQNAEPFGLERTRVVANGRRAIDDARRVREALGVGRVGVSRVPSGVGDITIIVGEDFTG